VRVESREHARTVLAAPGPSLPREEPSGLADEEGQSVEATQQAQCAVSARNEPKQRPVPDRRSPSAGLP
jgi:hypothetical protein